MTVDAPFLFVDSQECIGRLIHGGNIKILSAPTWHGDLSVEGHRLYRCLANVNGALCLIQVRLTIEV